MNKGDVGFTAAPAAAGYLYQARMALLSCIPYVNAGRDVEVAIERFDDVSFESGGVPFELLQTKHHIGRAGNLADASPDLWKTIRAWSTAAATDPSMPSRIKLVLITTAEVPIGSAASHLLPSAAYQAGLHRSPTAARELLDAVARSSLNASLKPAFDVYLALSEAMRAAVLSAVEVLGDRARLWDVEQELEAALRLAAPSGKARLAREMLEGWWWPRVCRALASTPATPISIASLEAKLDDIRELLRRDALVVDFEHAEPSGADSADYDGLRFVQQLRLIGLGGNRLGYAKRDYYRAFAQRSKWTREHVVVDDELERFEKTLVEEWQPRFELMREGQQGRAPDDDALRRGARDLYDWVELEARFPFRSLTTKFLTVGSYHMLADALRVGWHRDYAEIIIGDR